MEIIILLSVLAVFIWIFRKTLKIVAKASEMTTEVFAKETMAQAIKRKAKIQLSDDDVSRALEVDAKLEKFGIDL